MTPERKKKESFQLPSNKVILIDLDSTLIDEDYQITDPKVYDEISRVQSLGWKLGLSSDSPLDSLQKWSSKLGLNGPIIAERGAIIRFNDGKEISTHNSLEYFKQLREDFTNYLIDQNTPFILGDVAQIIQNRPNFSNMVDSRLILLNAYRRHGLSFYAKFVAEDGKLMSDNVTLMGMISVIQEMQGIPPFEIVEDINSEYGIYIVSPKDVSKRNGAIILMAELGLNNIGMIGDSITDNIGNDIAIHYAVGNARDELKSFASYIAYQKYTKGVVNILQNIVS